MNVNYAYEYLLFLGRTSQNGDLQPKEFMYAINKAQRDYQDFLLGKLENFKYDTTTSTTGAEAQIKVSIDLAPFKVSNSIQAVNIVSGATYGTVNYPADYQYLTLMTDTQNRKIERIDDSRVPARFNSVIDPYTDNSKPFYVEDAGLWRIYPNSVNNILVTYYKKVTPIVWGYNRVNGLNVYDPTKSTDPLWDDLSMEEILSRAARILGFSLEQNSLVKIGEDTIIRGE